MVMVQSEESAKFDGMPRSAISTGVADFILPPEEMPAQLLAFVKHPPVARLDRSESLLGDEKGLDRIFALLRERTRVDFTHYKPSTVVRRIERRMAVNQTPDLREYVRFLELHPREITQLYRDMLIGVTSFFRDPEAFEELAARWVPRILERAEQGEVRLWVPGCSTGEEAYSLAMVAAECMERMGRTLVVRIFATDVDQDAVLRAASGVYPASIAADLPPGYLGKYFHTRHDEVQICRAVRQMVVFAQHNLVRDPPFTNRQSFAEAAAHRGARHRHRDRAGRDAAAVQRLRAGPP